jgi:nucleoside-triphosphatase THEP1
MITVLVTGEPGTGKTSVLARLSRNLPVAGVISRPRLDALGKRTGIVASFPDSGEEIDLATVTRIPGNERVANLVAAPAHAPFVHKRSAAADAPADSTSEGVLVGPWRFSPAAIATVNARLIEIAEESSRRATPTDSPKEHVSDLPDPVVLIDEIGPLELLRHGGFLLGLEAVMRSALPAIVVVRPALVEELRRTIGSFSNVRSPGHIHTVTIADPKHIEPTATRILAMLHRL